MVATSGIPRIGKAIVIGSGYTCIPVIHVIHADLSQSQPGVERSFLSILVSRMLQSDFFGSNFWDQNFTLLFQIYNEVHWPQFIFFELNQVGNGFDDIVCNDRTFHLNTSYNTAIPSKHYVTDLLPYHVSTIELI